MIEAATISVISDNDGSHRDENRMRKHRFFVMNFCIWLSLLSGCHLSHWQRTEEGVTGHIRIESATSEAEIFVNNQNVGRTPLQLPVSYVRTTTLNITAVAVNHGELRQELTVELPPVPEKIIVLNFDAPVSAGEQSDGTEYGEDDRSLTEPPVSTPEVIEKTVVMEKYILPPVVFFDTDRYDIKEPYRKELEKFAALMQKNHFDMEIIGYADERHNITYNQVLSLNRSRAVYTLLKELGLEESRMQVEGRGKLYTIDIKGKRFAWEHDRRVEIHLKEIPQQE